MCGITGICRWDGRTDTLDALIQSMTSALAHRGPDGEGRYVQGTVALGHRRLAIIDLDTGQQPMCNEDGTCWITYNGEIYNYRELRDELTGRGHQFKSSSDTEVIIHAYEEWGRTCVERFRGMFAFAIADFQNRSILLARDHFGIKPLYYRIEDGYVAFASELPALRDIDGRAPKGNLLSVDLFLRYQYIPSPHTIYQTVRKLPPASTIVVPMDAKADVQPERYWDLRFSAGEQKSDAEWLEEAEAVIRDSVRAHLVSDVPFGVFVSGGIDSSLVALNMSRLLERPVEAFTIAFQEQEYSELEYANRVAERAKIALHSQVVQEDMLSILPELSAHYGEPFGDSSALPAWFVSRLARAHVPMVLSGDGGDEGFAGYQSYLLWMGESAFGKLARNWGISRKQAIRELFAGLLHGFTADMQQRLEGWQRYLLYFDGESRKRLWRPVFRQQADVPCALFQEAARVADGWDRLDYAQYLDYRTYLPNDILTKVDVASMYHGLEVRTPLIDVRVIEFAARLPRQQKLRGHGQQATGKYLLKQLLLRELPREFVYRSKQGFAIPRDRWFMPGRQGHQRLEAMLADSDSPLHAWFDTAYMRQLIDIHHAGADRSNQLWLLLILGIWLEQNRDIQFA